MSVSSTAGRMRASAGLLLAVATMVTVACTLVALVPVYSTAIVDAGLRGTVADADATDRAIDVTLRAPAEETADVFATLAGGVLTPTADAFEAAAFVESRAFSIVDPPLETDEQTGTTLVTSLAAVEGADLFRVVDGDLDDLDELDELGGESVGAPWPAALHVDAAERVGIATDDVVLVRPPNGGDDDTIALRVVALVEPVDPADARWFGEPLGRLGVTATGSFTELGPFFVGVDDFATLGTDAAVTGRFALDDSALGPDSVDGLIDTVDGAGAAFEEALSPRSVRVETGLDTLLRDTDTSVRSTSAVVAAIMLQLAAVALYGLGVAAAVLVASRRTERVLLHSRGISTWQVGREAASEALAVAVPAALVGPFLAVIAVRLVSAWGPLATSGLELRGDVSIQALAVSLLTAGTAAVIITWPAVSAARAPTSEATRETRDPFLRRTGLDIVLLVVAVLGLWQLHRTGSVATSASPDGRASVDPVLVLAPTLGVAAASLLAVRLLGLVASGLERIGTRSRHLAPALAGWEAARAGARRNRSSVLIVVAVAVASFALVHAVSWERSQSDQADAAVGADIVVTPDLRPDAGVAPADLASEYRALDGVDDVTPIVRRAAALTSSLGAVPLVAIDAGRYEEFARLRTDVVASPADIAELAAPPPLSGTPLPAGGGEVTATMTLAATSTDADTLEAVPVDTDVELALIVVDEFGTMHRMSADVPATSNGGPVTVSFGRLAPSGSDESPPSLVELEVTTAIAFVDANQFGFGTDDEDQPTPFDIPGNQLDMTIASLSVDGEEIDLPTVSPIVPGPRRFTLRPVEASAGDVLTIDTGTTAQRQATDVVRFVTHDLDDDTALPTIDVLATPTLLDGLGLRPGGLTLARIGGLRVELRVAGTTEVVPYASGDDLALLADHATLAAIDYLASGARHEPDDWALDVTEADHVGVSASLRSLPFSSVEVEDRWAAAQQRTRDPVLLGLTGSLLMAIAAVGAVALVGLAMSAVTGARERRSAHAVLRALGASRGELRRWLARETIPLGVVATLVGVCTGMLIAALVLTSLTGDRDGTAAVPPPQLVIPWTAILLLVLAALTAVAVLPAVMSQLLRGVRPADELRIGDQR
ncbi:MAG: FtsX-like permease family protein [Ilumatobacteraceae bacterium]